jgi:hypothetical protein
MVSPLLVVIFDIQVTACVVELMQLGSVAAAALVPIMSVVNSFCICCEHILYLQGRVLKKRKILYISILYFRERFLNLVAEAEMQQAKTIHPLDALKGMLQWKLVKLMRRTKGHVKRTADELLWIVCNQKE